MLCSYTTLGILNHRMLGRSMLMRDRGKRTVTTDLTAEDLTQLRFFRGESPDVLEWLLDACQRRTLKPEDILLEPGQSNHLMYVILSGSLQVRLERESNVISVLTQGESAGEMSVLDSAHTSAWVIAESVVELMELDARHVWSLITHSHIVAVNLLSILSNRVRSDNRVIDKSQQLKNFYEYHAKVDALTGLHNRRWLDETLTRLSRLSRVNGQPLGIIMLDADYFKAYNDTHGHLAGDAALHAIGKSMQIHIRPNDIAARFGGEEFVVLLPDTGLRKALDVAERLCSSIREVVIRAEDGQLLPHVTVSAGVATAQPGDEAGHLLGAADAALYRAKQMGRDRACS